MTRVLIIWPDVNRLQEEPLSLFLHEEGLPLHPLPAYIVLSRTSGPQLLLGRLSNGKVMSWRFNGTRNQLEHELVVGANAHLVAASDDGCWVAMVFGETGSEAKGSAVRVLSLQTPQGLSSN